MIEVSNLVKKYGDHTAVDHLSFQIEKGKIYGFLGPNGAGKSTTMNMITGYIASTEGKVMIDGHDIKDFSRHDLRSLFGMVLQDTWLFNGTIKENLMYGKLDASDEEVKNACEMAYVDHFVNTLEDGYDTVLDEETSNISQGQKQLLTIARAILADPKILILDEATSSLDPETEVKVLKSVKSLSSNPTCIIITHRPSALNICNRIMKLEKGHIREVSRKSILEVANELV